MKNADLRAYQNAVSEIAVMALNADGYRTPLYPKATALTVCFAFWRQRAVSRSTSGRTTTSQIADATNMQKATEDALQKIIFDNDRHNASVCSHVIEQGTDVEPAVLVIIERADMTILIPTAAECDAWRREGRSDLAASGGVAWIKEINR